MKENTHSRNQMIILTSTALMTAVMCILGPLSVPVGPVPISLTNLAIYLTLYVLDCKRSLIAYLVYLLIGCAGVPVFSAFTGGVQKLAGPTGGYLTGFILMILVAGSVIDKFWNSRIICILAMEAATWICYLTGTLWLSFSADMSFQAALAAGVLPFILVDLIKILIAACIGPVLKKRLTDAHLTL